MLNNKGMTLSEVLIGMFIFSIISLMFTSGLMAVLRIIGLADSDREIELAADEMMLTNKTVVLDEDSLTPEFADDKQYEATIKFNNSNKTLTVKGTLNRASVVREDGRPGSLRLQYIYKGLDLP